MSIQQMLLGAGVKKKTYIEDVFKVHLYEGNATNSRDIVNGVDLAGDGGMVWTKNWDSGSYGHNIFDTERGAGKMLTISNNNAEANETNTLTQFNSNGFRINADNNINKDTDDYVSWSFKKSPGFFDCVKYTGDGSTSRDISHSLGCRPGMIILRDYDSGNDWWVYHHELEEQQDDANWSMVLKWNNDGTRQNNIENIGSDTTHTATTFRIGSGNNSNVSGRDYIVYLFAGSYNTGVTGARSIKLPTTASSGSTNNQYISVDNSTDYNISTGDWTIECYVKMEKGGDVIFSSGKDGTSYEACMFYCSDNTIKLYCRSTSAWIITDTIGKINYGTWHHVAATRNGNVFRGFIDGRKCFEETHNVTLNNNSGKWTVGGRLNGNTFRGSISNFRYTKGQALYTASFIPSKVPLTTTSQGATASNVKMLCCNGSTTTSSTVVSGTLSQTGSDIISSPESPFPDPKAAIFGDSGDQDIIKVGHYAPFPESSYFSEIHLGWEPQFVMIKSEDINAGGDWHVWDSSRGSFAQRGINQRVLRANTNDSEDGRDSWLEATPTGFRITDDNDEVGKGQYGDTVYYYTFIAIRRPDTLVTKAPEAASEVFAMDTAASSIPKYNAGFELDTILKRRPSTTVDWRLSTRLSGYKVLRTNLTNASIGDSANVSWNNTDNMTKFDGGGGDESGDTRAWMWKRHAGFDVVINTRPDDMKDNHIDLRHNLGKIPEMIWVKNAASDTNWYVWHKDLNEAGGGNNSVGYRLMLQSDDAQTNNYGSNYGPIVDYLPTSTHWRCGSDQDIRHNTSIAFLFASVAGISKVGSYTGSSSSQTITTGFTPRFLMVKRYNGSGHWYIIDTMIGNLGSSGNDTAIYLNKNETQGDLGANYVNTTSTGFVMPGNVAGDFHYVTAKYIYYAHA